MISIKYLLLIKLLYLFPRKSWEQKKLWCRGEGTPTYTLCGEDVVYAFYVEERNRL